ncbi:unnamed protein product [Effrenium voratum]|uniref:DNA2/NAM7 helicase-like C-terminal domain-containing protein n=1 Tax=Effrenium voratum TaxID=2562239 RepID=A0AA36NHU0_9DINO|nr:unnamed protein product [Effrenium voratum]
MATNWGLSRLVLVGDPKQLRPISSFNSHKFSQEDLDVLAPFAQERQSVFEAFQRHRRPCMLQVQYRMQPELCTYPSERFYDGELVTAPSLARRPMAVGDGFVFKEGTSGHPVIFVDTCDLGGSEEQVRLGGSISLQNRLEARVVSMLLQGFQEAGVESSRLSVISAYSGQNSLLAQVLHGASPAERLYQRKMRSMLIRRKGIDPLEREAHPRIGTVDGFQGNENDFIIFSAVRSSPQGTCGFLADRHRLCVLLTRARHGLVVVGDSSTLQRDPEWAAWLQAEKQVVTVDAAVLQGRN